MISQDGEEAKLYKLRKIYSQITHALEHLIRGADGDKRMAIKLLQQALDDHKEARRKSDRKK